MDKATIKYILRFKRKNLDEEDIANILEVDIDEVKRVISISDTLNEVYAKRKLKKDNSVKTKKDTSEKKTISRIPKKEKIAKRKTSYYEEEKKKETLIRDYNSYKSSAISEIKNKTDVILYRNNFFNKAKELVQSGKAIPLEDIKVLADSVSTVPDLFKSYNISFVIKCYEKYDAKDKIIDFIDDCMENENHYGNDKYINDLVEKYGELSARQKEIKKEKRKIEAAEAKKKKEEKKQRKINEEKEWNEEQRRNYEKLVIVKRREKENLEETTEKTVIEKEERKKRTTQNSSVKENNSETKSSSSKRKQINNRKHTLYEYFSDNSKEEIDKVLPSLTDKQKELLNTYFDKDLKRNEIPQKPGEVRNLIAGIKSRIERKSIPKKTLYDYLEEYTKNEVDDALTSLTDKQRETLTTYFDENLKRNDVSQKPHVIKDLVLGIKSRIEKIKNKENDNTNYLYKLFSDYTKEEIDAAALLMTYSQREKLKKYYDENLVRNNIPLDYSDEKRSIITGLRGRLVKVRKKGITLDEATKVAEKSKKTVAKKRAHKDTLYDYLEEYTKEEIDTAIPTLTDKQKEILNKYFDIDLKRNKVSEKDIRIVNLLNGIRARIEYKKTEENDNSNNLYSYFSDYTKEEISLALEILTDSQKEKIKNYFDQNLIKNGTPYKYRDEKKNLLDAIQKRLTKVREQKSNKKATINRQSPTLRKNRKGTLFEYLDGYSKEDVNKAILTLTDRQKIILNAYFDKELKRNDVSQKPGEIGDMIKGIKARIDNEKSNKPKSYTKGTTHFTLFDYMKDYSKEEIIDVLPTLTNRQKEILGRYFDDKYNRNKTPQIPGEMGELIRAITSRIVKLNKKAENAKSKEMERLKYIEKNKPKGTLYDYLKDYSKEEVDKAILTLTDKQKAMLNTYFDSELKRNDIPQKPGEIRDVTRGIISRINNNKNPRIKKEKRLVRKNKKDTLYDYFENYSKADVDKAILTLTDKQSEVLNKYFDNDLKRNSTSQESGEMGILISGIKTRVKRKEEPKKTLYDYLNEYTSEEVDKALLVLTDRQKEILGTYFDDDLKRNKTPQAPNSVKDLVKGIKIRINNERKKANDTTNNIYKYFEKYKPEEVDLAISLLSTQQKQKIKKYYDENLEKNDVKFINQDKTNLLAAIQKKLQQGKKYNNYNDICENFNEYSREQVLLVANNLTKKAKIYRETYYDDELKRNDVPAENTTTLSNLYNAIRTRLGHFDKIEETLEKSKEEPIEILEVDNSNNKIIEKKNFAEYFSDYDISFNIIKKLIEVDKDRQKFIYKYFDKNLNTTINTISEEDFVHLNQIIDHIKDLAEFEKKVREAKLQNKLGSLYGYDNEVQEENKEDAIKNNEEKHNSEPIEEITENIADNSNLTTDISDNLDVSNEDLINIYQMFKTGYFLSFLEQKSEIEIKVMKMKLGYQDQKYFPSKHIAEELNITEDEAIRIYKNIIKEYEEILLKELEKERQKNRKRTLTYEQEHDSTKQG